ncbi:MAG: hypothetical protein AAFZ89_12095 [Bacteroidota bacterium]
MKTYSIWYLLLVLVCIGCSESDDGQNPGNDDDFVGVDADYSLLIANNGTLSGIQLNATADVITKNPEDGDFGTIPLPSITYRDGLLFTYFEKKSDCSGNVISYNFDGGSSTTIDVFEDKKDCALSVISMASAPESFFLAYGVPNSMTMETDFFIRTVNTVSSDFVDTPVDERIVQVEFSNNRLFILTIGEGADEKYTLFVLDTATNELIHEMNLDEDVQRIGRNETGNILVSYEELHLMISPNTLATLSTVRYNDGTEPKFGLSERSFFDSEGNLYFQRQESTGGFPSIPAVYDFSSNTAILYFYENFLNEQQRNIEFEIGDTAMVSYDAKNNLILIGYSKDNTGGEGGLLRIKPAPDPKFIDNIDLEGVPYDIFVE